MKPVILSLNEIGATATKAVQGCGHSVGIAQDLGFAARWLCARELPGVAVLLAALDGFTPAEVSLLDDGTGRRVLTNATAGGDGALSALLVAPSLVELVLDRGPTQPQPVEVEALTHPLLLVSFVARDGSNTVAARWSTAEGPVVIEPMKDGLQVRATNDGALAAMVGTDVLVGSAGSDENLPVAISSAELHAARLRSVAKGCSVADDDWERLGRLAWRTYVPVSDESRLRGAGAGLTDND